MRGGSANGKIKRKVGEGEGEADIQQEEVPGSEGCPGPRPLGAAAPHPRGSIPPTAGETTGGGNPERPFEFGMKEDGERGVPCRERDTTVLSPSREIITSEFPGAECPNKSLPGMEAVPGAAALGWERTHCPARDTQGGQAPTALRGHAGMGAQERAHLPHHLPRRSRCLFRLQATRLRGLAGGGQTRAGDPQKSPWELSVTQGPSQASRGCDEVCGDESGAGPGVCGRHLGPEGMGWAPPAAAQMFLRGTPPLFGAPRGERGRREPGAAGAAAPSSPS